MADEKILCSDDAEQRGIQKANFTIICECGRPRRFIFTEKTWDIMPCPACKASGMTNNKEVSWQSLK